MSILNWSNRDPVNVRWGAARKHAAATGCKGAHVLEKKYLKKIGWPNHSWGLFFDIVCYVLDLKAYQTQGTFDKTHQNHHEIKWNKSNRLKKAFKDRRIESLEMAGAAKVRSETKFRHFKWNVEIFHHFHIWFIYACLIMFICYIVLYNRVSSVSCYMFHVMLHVQTNSWPFLHLRAWASHAREGQASLLHLCPAARHLN